MKKSCALLFLLFAVLSGIAQEPVKWNFSARKIAASTYEVHLTASIEDDWHIYSQTTPDGGPVATSVIFSKNPLVSLQGSVKEAGKMEQRFEELFGVVVKQFSGKVDFVQNVQVKADVKTTLNGSVEYMTCNDRECMPPKKQAFSIMLK